MFLIPSVKVYNRKYSKSDQSIAKVIHDFLNENFNGYTCTSGNIFGYFKSETTEYDELREFRVAFLEDDRKTKVPKLQEFIEKICVDIGEECIYLELGEDAMLVYPDEAVTDTSVPPIEGGPAVPNTSLKFDKALILVDLILVHRVNLDVPCLIGSINTKTRTFTGSFLGSDLTESELLEIAKEIGKIEKTEIAGK